MNIDSDTTLYRLIKLLSDCEWHSGESLGQALGVSRAAIAKQLKQFDELDLKLEVVKGTGYRLKHPIDLLEGEKIRSMLSEENISCRIDIFGSLDSTNSYLMNAFRSNESIHSRICLAERQTAGRGRRGRQWHSPFAQNIYLSIAWRFEEGVAALEGLSLAVGVAVCRVLESFGLAQARLKWPNDVLYEGKKLGGILIELGGDAVSDCAVVIGVGLNVSMRAEGGQEIDQPWCSLKSLGYSATRTLLAKALVAELVKLLDSYAQKGFSSYRDEWNALDAYAGQNVTLSSASSTESGVMLGVSETGALMLKTNGTFKEFVGGELSLRLKG